MYINKAIIYGNLTRDPEVRSLPSGIQVCSFSLATNRVYKDRDGKKQESVDYHNVALFGKQAELAGQYLKKGSGVMIEGRLQTQSWEKDGVKQYRTEIVADRMQFGPRSSGGGAPAGNTTSNEAGRAPEKDAGMDNIEYPSEEINPDDIPF